LAEEMRLPVSILPEYLKRLIPKDTNDVEVRIAHPDSDIVFTLEINEFWKIYKRAKSYGNGLVSNFIYPSNVTISKIKGEIK
jgi:hypothetical protein